MKCPRCNKAMKAQGGYLLEDEKPSERVVKYRYEACGYHQEQAETDGD